MEIKAQAKYVTSIRIVIVKHKITLETPNMKYGTRRTKEWHSPNRWSGCDEDSGKYQKR